MIENMCSDEKKDKESACFVTDEPWKFYRKKKFVSLQIHLDCLNGGKPKMKIGIRLGLTTVVDKLQTMSCLTKCVPSFFFNVLTMFFLASQHKQI